MKAFKNFSWYFLKLCNGKVIYRVVQKPLTQKLYTIAKNFWQTRKTMYQKVGWYCTKCIKILNYPVRKNSKKRTQKLGKKSIIRPWKGLNQKMPKKAKKGLLKNPNLDQDFEKISRKVLSLAITAILDYEIRRKITFTDDLS